MRKYEIETRGRKERGEEMDRGGNHRLIHQKNEFKPRNDQGLFEKFLASEVILPPLPFSPSFESLCSKHFIDRKRNASLK